MAMTFTSCRNQPQARNCVDENNRIVQDQDCYDLDRNRANGYTGYWRYRWLYGGSSGGHFGDTVFNGSTTPHSGGGFFGSGGFGSGVERGGFGTHFGVGG